MAAITTTIIAAIAENINFLCFKLLI